MVNTEPMTQRVELATVRDRLDLDGLVTDYAVALDDGDWAAYRRLFTPDGRADHRGAGGIEGDSGTVAAWLAERFSGFPVRQHLFVNRRVRLRTWEGDTGDTAEVRTDYVSPVCRGGGGAHRRARPAERRTVRVHGGAHPRRLAAEPGRRAGDVAAPDRRTAGRCDRLNPRPAGSRTHTGGITG